jgi:putative peptidoglycan lipid II flippase
MRIPNVLQNLFGEGVLSASFIPVYAASSAEASASGRPGRRGVAAMLALARPPRGARACVATPWLVASIAAGFDAPDAGADDATRPHRRSRASGSS